MKPRDLRHEDGGVASRKMWFAAFTAVLIVVSARILPEATAGQAIAGLVTVCGIYVGGNAATKWILGRQPVASKSPPATPTQEKK